MYQEFKAGRSARNDAEMKVIDIRESAYNLIRTPFLLCYRSKASAIFRPRQQCIVKHIIKLITCQSPKY